MQLSERQQQFLAELEIPVWQLRSTLSQAEVDNNAAKQPQSSLSIDLSPSVWLLIASAEMDDSEQRLLTAMLKASGLSRQAVAILDVHQFESIASTELTNKTLLLLGTGNDVMPSAVSPAQPTIIQQADSRWIASYSLKDMLQQPALKATVWQALKLLQTVN